MDQARLVPFESNDYNLKASGTDGADKGAEQGLWPACQVGNFRVEPPGLFRGRGDHPKMGKFKRRIYPCDITINIGAHPLAGPNLLARSTSPVHVQGSDVSCTSRWGT